ncbi:MAG: VOC family protein, partial [Terracidiphilus sp.]
RTPPRAGEVTHSVIVRVEDVRSHYERAKAHGAEIIDELTDFPFGERQYSAKDFAGHQWTFSETLNDVAPEEWGGKSINAE